MEHRWFRKAEVARLRGFGLQLLSRSVSNIK
jgi:hypothetical protein